MRPRFAAVFGRFSSGSLYNAESRRILSCAITIAIGVFVLTGCATQQQPLTGPWTVAIATSGGLTGKGIGTWVVTSEGTLSVTSPRRQTCSMKISAEDVRRIEERLVASRFEEWAPSYRPKETCCDRIDYTMSIETSRGQVTTRWIDDPLPMPEDLVRVATAIGPWSSDEASVSRRYKCSVDGDERRAAEELKTPVRASGL